MSIEEIAFEAEERMEKSIALLADQLKGVRTGRANTGPGRLDPRRVLRLADAAEAARQPEHARAPADPDPAVRPDRHRRHRQGDPGQRPRPDAELRQQGRPPQRPLALRRAAQEARRPRQGPRRGGPDLDPQHPPRRQQVGRQGAARQDPDRGRRREVQGRDPGPDQAVRGQGQRDGREEVGRDPRSLRKIDPRALASFALRFLARVALAALVRRVDLLRRRRRARPPRVARGHGDRRGQPPGRPLPLRDRPCCVAPQWPGTGSLIGASGRAGEAR